VAGAASYAGLSRSRAQARPGRTGLLRHPCLLALEALASGIEALVAGAASYAGLSRSPARHGRTGAASNAGVSRAQARPGRTGLLRHPCLLALEAVASALSALEAVASALEAVAAFDQQA